MDNLRTLNLKNGRDFGDALLRDVKFILQDEVPEGCEVYRISGDWFAVNLPDLTAVKVSRIFAKARERLRASAPFRRDVFLLRTIMWMIKIRCCNM